MISVEIIRDEWGIPHIYAENREDLFFAQGFVHAQDRLFQLDFNRRLIAGRLSEILGELTLPLDRWMKTLTLRRVAEFEAAQLDPIYTAELSAYASGINAYIHRGKLPIEFTLLRYQPEDWIVADTLSWIKMMAWSLSVNWESELLRAQLIARLGPEKAAELEPPHLSRWPFVVPPDLDYSSLDLSALERTRLIRPFAGPTPYDGLGSNNWVVSGALTQSGKPLLANDMHLGLTSPAIWYENHLSCGDLSVTGVTFPSIPGVVAGHNGHVAWSFTNGFPDVQDLYVERLNRTSDGLIEVEYDGKWENATIIKEPIRIKDRKTVMHEVVITRHGPIINELAPDLCGDLSLSLQWTALDPDDFIRCVFEIWQAKTCDDLHEALKFWSTPSQNVVYADQQGNIAYTLAGKIPLRKKGQGRIPVPGWTSEYGWKSYIPHTSLPHFKNPNQQFIVSANNRVFDINFPVAIELEPITGDRAQRIAEMLMDPGLRSENDKIDASLFKRMHYDQCSPSARVVSRYLAQLKIPESAHHNQSDIQYVLNLFKSWDGVLAVDSPTALIYESFIRKLVWMIFQDKLDPSSMHVLAHETGDNHHKHSDQVRLTSYFLGKGPTPVLAETTLFGDHWLPWLTDHLRNTKSPWFDLGNGENRDECLLKIMTIVIDDLKKEHGADINRWRWGQRHQLTFKHPLGTNPILGSIFNLGPFPIGGDNTTIWAAGTHYHDLETSDMVGPPYRMIVDLGNFNNSVAVLAPGQSSNPASPYFANQINGWFNGVYHPMLFDRREIEKKARHRLRIL